MGALPEVSREDDDAIVTERFNKCAFRICLTLANGEIHHCGRGVNASKVLSFEPAPEDCVKVRNNENLRQDFFNYVYKPRFENACRYCNGTWGVRKIPPAEQL